ncbi:glycosyltransferase [Aeromonas sp. 603404]|uniref:glycosyltransferase n=1 Tax=Aeromonas sp. 603404 TaxID=2712047 RepID=UPI003BA187E9
MKKNYGIFLSYAPNVDLRSEGLGRYLASFMKGAISRNEVQFTIVCPSWSKSGLYALFESENVPLDKFVIQSPDSKPLILSIYEKYISYKKNRRNKYRILSNAKEYLRHLTDRYLNRVESYLISAVSLRDIIPILFEVAIIGILLIGLAPVFIALLMFVALLIKISSVVKGTLLKFFIKYLIRMSSIISSPKNDGLVISLYNKLEAAESKRMLNLVDSLSDISAWYCPTAFWPEFNKIHAPRLLCVPDVVLTEFPVGFCNVGGERFLQTFRKIESTIRDGDHFVTYSNKVKWDTLVERYKVNPAHISVIHHAPNTLDRTISPDGKSLQCEEVNLQARSDFMNALKKSNKTRYISGFSNDEVKFIFYASQTRPNKNMLSLFKAYNYLLRERFLSCKLIVTGSQSEISEIATFIKEQELELDVLFLHGLSVPELAACYHLAELAVNPSLSEGGCPFTFTEALSVNTPVVMARIPVTEEILTDPELQEMTFFDPYDWRDMAKRIEWALHHKDILLRKQLQIYDQLSMRTWSDVVNEHIDILERISCLEK